MQDKPEIRKNRTPFIIFISQERYLLYHQNNAIDLVCLNSIDSWRSLVAKLVEMAHFRPVLRMASGTLASSEMRLEQGEIPLPQRLNAKQRRLSRPNTREEIRARRLKRKEKKKKQHKFLSKKERKAINAMHIANKIKRETSDMKTKLIIQRKYANEQRKRAIYFWKSWRTIKNNGYVYSLFENLTIYEVKTERGGYGGWAWGEPQGGDGFKSSMKTYLNFTESIYDITLQSRASLC